MRVRVGICRELGRGIDAGVVGAPVPPKQPSALDGARWPHPLPHSSVCLALPRHIRLVFIVFPFLFLFQGSSPFIGTTPTCLH